MGNSGNEVIDYLFDQCVYALSFICDVTGLSYEALNLILFVGVFGLSLALNVYTLIFMRRNK